MDKATTAPTRVLVAGLILVLSLLGSYVMLEMSGHNADGLVQAVGYVLGLLGLAGHVEARSRQQRQALDTITRQTNGVLDERIAAGSAKAVRRVLREAGYTNVRAED